MSRLYYTLSLVATVPLLVSITLHGKVLPSPTRLVPVSDAKNLMSHQLITGSRRIYTGIGQLIRIVDGGYPLGTLMIKPVNGQSAISLTINYEEGSGISIESVSAMLHKKVSYSYQRVAFNDLMDVQSNGKLIDELTNTKGLKKIAGILRGADRITQGDLPDTIQIISASGVHLSFPKYITDNMVKVNGLPVVGFYQVRVDEVIRSIRLVK